ncbi:DUF1963 domain-containing protein [Streptomyces sp. NPDC008343]|uniref:DUF1963 domain-containing protein n=1 Tax=Streptomyces sp. NPDC008343 TaxID=3364828 RepID=UPI0036E3FFCE
MSGFGQWLGQFEKSDDEIGDLARFVATDPHKPRIASGRGMYMVWLALHPDVRSADGPAEHPLLPAFRAAWDRYTHEMADDTPLSDLDVSEDPVQHPYDALLAAMEGGTQGMVLTHLTGLELDADRREALMTRATAVRHALADHAPHFDERYMRTTTVGLVCHTDVDAAAEWLTRPRFAGREPAGPEDMARHLADAVCACWTPERVEDFVRAAARGDRGSELYPLVLELCRRTGITVEPSSGLAAGAVAFYVGWRESEQPRPPHGLAVTADPLEDPLLPRVLPELDLARRGVYDALGESVTHGSVEGRYFVRFLLENGLLDRGLFLRKVVDSLKRAAEEESQSCAVAFIRSASSQPSLIGGSEHYISMLEDLRPTEEEFSACHESYAKLASAPRATAMSGALLARAVGALRREGRLHASLVDGWVRGVLSDDDTADTCAIAIGETSGTGLLTDAHVADLVRFVTSNPPFRPLAVMRALIRHAEQDRLTADQIAACAREALIWPEEDVAGALIALIGRVLKHEPDRSGGLVPLLADSFWHPSPEVQGKALDVAAEHRERLDGTARGLLAEAALQLDTDLRERALALFGPDSDRPASSGAAAGPVAGSRVSAFPSLDVGIFDPVVRTLPAEAGERWRSLLRPAVTLAEGDGEGPVVGYLGGLPDLPKVVPWPMWRGRPLPFQASLDCALLPGHALDIPLPEDGTLLFFCYVTGELDADDEDDLDDFFPGCEGFEPGEGARLLYIPASEATMRRSAPPECAILPPAPLRLNRVGPTMPDPAHVCLHDAGIRAWEVEGMARAMDDVSTEVKNQYGAHHTQVGGYAQSLQRGAETEVAQLLAGGYDAPAETVREAARDIVMLASFEEPELGDMLYWMIRREDLATGRFDRAMPLWQG